MGVIDRLSKVCMLGTSMLCEQDVSALCELCYLDLELRLFILLSRHHLE